jgi:hypothetical protein
MKAKLCLLKYTMLLEVKVNYAYASLNMLMEESDPNACKYTQI